MRTSHRTILTALATLAVASSILVVSSASASAALVHPFLKQIKEIGGPPPVPFAGGELGGPVGLSFDSAGNLFVAEPLSFVTDVLNPANGFEGEVELGTATGDSKYTRSVAVDDATGDVYVADSNLGELFVFKPKGSSPSEGYELLSVWTGANTNLKSFGGGWVFVAVDNSTNPLDPHRGDVYILNYENQAVEVVRPKPSEEATEEFVEEFSLPEEVNFAAKFGGTLGIAVNGQTDEGYVTAPNKGVVYQFNDKGEFQLNDNGESVPPLNGSATHAGSFAPTAVAIEEPDGDLYVADPIHGAVDQFDATGKYLGATEEGQPGVPEKALTGAVGVAVSPVNEDVYVSNSSENVEAGATGLDVLGPGIVPPTLGIEPATEVNASSWTLKGTVNPNGVEASACRFEYSSSREALYAKAMPCKTSPGHGTTAVPVSAEIKGLEPNTTYHFRLFAENVSTSAHSGEESFTTRPGGPLVEATSAVPGPEPRKTELLSGAVNPNHSPTTYYFAYVNQAEYEAGYARTVTPEFGAGEGFAGERVGPVQINGLKAGTTYHYELVAINTIHTIHGEEHEKTIGPDQTFTTAPPTPPIVGAGQTSGVTQTSAVVTATIDPQGLQTSYELELGTDTTYGGARIFGVLPVGEESITVDLGGLAPGTTYHYRIVAENEDGETVGPDQSFTTQPAPTLAIQPPTEQLLPIPKIEFPTAHHKVEKKKKKKKKKKKGSKGGHKNSKGTGHKKTKSKKKG
jgi:hypothetical protein